MPELVVLATPAPRLAGVQPLKRAVRLRLGLERFTRRSTLPVADLHTRLAHRSRRFSPQRPGPHLVEVPIRVSLDGNVDESDLHAVSCAVEALRRGDRLLIALTPPGVLVEHLWRCAVWSGASVEATELPDALPEVNKGYERLTDLTSGVAGCHVVPLIQSAHPSVGTVTDAAWQVSVRGMRILARMNRFAESTDERHKMREFCRKRFPFDLEPAPALPSHVPPAHDSQVGRDDVWTRPPLLHPQSGKRRSARGPRKESP